MKSKEVHTKINIKSILFEIIIKGRDGTETGSLPEIYSINYNIDDLCRDLWPLLELKLPAVCLACGCLVKHLNH